MVYATIVLWATQSTLIEFIFYLFGEGDSTLGERAGMVTAVLFLYRFYSFRQKKTWLTFSL